MNYRRVGKGSRKVGATCSVTTAKSGFLKASANVKKERSISHKPRVMCKVLATLTTDTVGNGFL